jgi:hypothetical protein
MSGLFSLLLFVAFFYVMMRFGCGTHMVHGDHGGWKPALQILVAQLFAHVPIGEITHCHVPLPRKK